MCYGYPTHVPRIRYDLNTEKLYCTTATQRYDLLPFLTCTVVPSFSIQCTIIYV